MLLAASALAPPSAAAQLRTTDANVIPGQYIVVYKGSAESVKTETNARERELGFEADARFRHALKGFSTALTRAQVRDLRRDPEVAHVTPDRRVQASSLVPATPGEHVPTGLRRLAAAASTSVEHASGVGVAVLDSGVNLQHPDLDVSHGTNCVTPGLTADDDEGHGTHVAGTVAAKNNGSGVTGVAPGTKIWAVKVLNSTGSGSFSSIACGLDWVTAHAAALNIKVVNMSLGGTGDPVASCGRTADPLHQAICRVIAVDVLIVAATGNKGWDFDFAAGPDVPAAYPEVLAVTAMSDSDGRAAGSATPRTATPSLPRATTLLRASRTSPAPRPVRHTRSPPPVSASLRPGRPTRRRRPTRPPPARAWPPRIWPVSRPSARTTPGTPARVRARLRRRSSPSCGAKRPRSRWPTRHSGSVTTPDTARLRASTSAGLSGSSTRWRLRRRSVRRRPPRPARPKHPSSSRRARLGCASTAALTPAHGRRAPPRSGHRRWPRGRTRSPCGQSMPPGTSTTPRRRTNGRSTRRLPTPRSRPGRDAGPPRVPRRSSSQRASQKLAWRASSTRARGKTARRRSA